MDVVAAVGQLSTWPALATAGLLCGLMFAAKLVYRGIFGLFEYHADEARHAYMFQRGQPPGMTRETAVEEMKRSRRIGDIPPVYPNGWFAVLRSEELGKKETKFVHALGLHLAVFRGESGQVYIVDAYCPHLGANLAIGGKVRGECIECPFHGWTYRGDNGKCVKIAYAEKVPDFVKVDTHHSLEINGLIMIWYHAEKEEPSWYPPEIEGVKDGQLRRGGFFQAYFEAHIQDVVENSGDISHLNHLHGPQIYDKLYTGTWELHPTQQHVSISQTTITNNSSNFVFSSGTIDVRVEQHGPGMSYVYSKTGVIIVVVTPVQPLRQKVIFTKFMTRGFKYALFNKLQMYFSFLGLQGDIMVWANKTYKANPPYVKEDSSIARHRKWFSQFYTEHSPRFVPTDPMQW